MAGISAGHQTIIDLLSVARMPGLIVDIGAFPGSVTRHLPARGWKVVAIDKDPQRGIDTNGRNLNSRSISFATAMTELGVQVLKADIEHDPLPLGDGEADAALLTEVIEHLYVNPLFTLSEINRILKPSGILILSTPNLLSVRNRFNFLRGRMDRIISQPYDAFLQEIRFGHKGHVRLYAPSELKTILGSLGFDVEFHLRSLEFWEGDETVMPTLPRRRSPFRRLLRSPRSYLDAGIATARVTIERLAPECRPHMFAICRKVRSVRLQDLKHSLDGVDAR
jgi:SAM-dependent methyltransferase